MATHDYVIDNSTGANVRADINLVLQAILTNNSSSSAPSTTAAYMWWADTTNGVLKIRNSSNNDWVELLQLDGTLTLEDGSASTPGLAFRDDLNTGIFSSASDTFNVATAGVERMELGATTIFNEDGADVDFRIEGDTNANLFYVDAGNNKIGIGTATPSNLLHLKSGAPAIQFEDTDANGSAVSIIEDNNGFLKLRCDTGNAGTGSGIGFEVDGSERMRIDTSGRLLIGSSSHVDNGGIEAHLQVLGTGTDDTSIILSRYSNDGSSPFLVFSKSRNGSIGGNTVLQDGDRIGRIKFFGNDGTDGSTPAAEIDVEVDGTPGSNDMPGRIVFKTTADGASSTTERMRIDSDGRLLVGTTTEGYSPDAETLTIAESGNSGMTIRSGTSNAGHIYFSDATSGSGEYVGQIGYNHNTNHLFFATDTTERMRIDSSGNLAIGTTSAAQKLHIDGSSNDPFVMLQRSGAGDSAVDIGGIQMKNSTNILADIRCRSDDINDGMLKFSTMSAGTLQERMRIQSDGDVSFSNSNSGSAQIKNVHGDQSSVNAGGFPQYAFNGNEGTGMRRPSANNLAFDTTGDERMRLDSSGNLLVGRTSSGNTGNGHTIRGGDSVILSRNATGETLQVCRNNSNGDLIQFRTGDVGTNASVCGEIVRTGSSSVAYQTSSDYRLKENEVAISDGITRLKLLKPYRFNFKSEPSKTVDGFYAHEVTPAVPEAIFGEKDDPNRMQGIDQSKLVPLLTAALQEAIVKIEVLETKVAALEAA